MRNSAHMEKVAVYSSMKQLTSREQHFINMVDGDNWSYAELAEAEGISEAAVRYITEAAREKFKRFFSACYPEHPHALAYVGSRCAS